MWTGRKFRKKTSRIWIKFISGFFILLIPILIFFSIKIGLFTIKQVEIEAKDIECGSENQFKDSLNLYGQNYFLLDPAKIESTLKRKFICIKTVTTKKYLPGKVILQILNRQPTALLLTLKEKQASSSSLIENIATPEASQIQDSYKIDSEGLIFSKDVNGLSAPEIYLYDPKISLGKKLDGELIGNSLRILEKIKTFGINVQKSWISDDFFIINPDISNPKLIFNLNGDINIQLASLQLILAEAKIDLMELKFIDLRFDKPIVKFAPKK